MIHAYVHDFTFRLEEKKGIWHVNGTPLAIDLLQENPYHLHLMHENRSYNIFIHKIDSLTKEVTLTLNGKTNTVRLESKTDLLLKSMGFDIAATHKLDVVKAAMPGLIHSVAVEAGQAVKKGDPLLILEAMKMENIIKSPGDGVVAKVHAVLKSSVEKGQVLISFE
jgi:biotin carboxyl carrier protein